jgi:hypothetical protein
MKDQNECVLRDGEIFIKTSKPCIINSFGSITRDGVRVSTNEAIHLTRTGMTSCNLSTVEMIDDGADAFRSSLFHCVNELKSCNFILLENGDEINAYYPDIRSKTLLEKDPPLKILVRYPYESYDIERGRSSGDTIICLAEAQNAELFVKISNLETDKFSPLC